jgi:hypothetical protein
VSSIKLDKKIEFCLYRSLIVLYLISEFCLCVRREWC